MAAARAEGSSALGDRSRTLRAALDALAQALAAGDVAAVLACEPALCAVLTPLPPGDAALDHDDVAAVRQHLAGARAALAHCRAIGAASRLVTDVTLDALGRGRPYDRHGAGIPQGARGRDLHARG